MEQPERLYNTDDKVGIAYGSVAWWLGKKVKSKRVLSLVPLNFLCSLTNTLASIPGVQSFREWRTFNFVDCFVSLRIDAMLNVSQTEEYYTHRWTVFVRGADNQDLRHVVQKVSVFETHEAGIFGSHAVFT